MTRGASIVILCDGGSNPAGRFVPIALRRATQLPAKKTGVDECYETGKMKSIYFFINYFIMKLRILKIRRKTFIAMFLCMGCLAVLPPETRAENNAWNTQTVQQQSKVSGIVKDEAGEPVIGASVVEKGAANGVITDVDGVFSLSVAPDATLVISYLGYISQEVKAESGRTLEIILKENVEALDEVVVIGYGVQKKSNVTGAISSVKSDDLQNKLSANAAASLQGKVSGVQIVNNSGAPSASPTIRVRGYSSNGASDPLYVVDGLKVSSIDYLEPGSIESIEILKDAASAAIYGAEAGNGVILITTKNGGTDGSAQITFDTQLTWSNLARKIDLMNAREFIQYNNEADATFATLLDKYYDGHTDTDWQDEIYKTGALQKYNLGMSGNNRNGSLFVSLGYMKNNGMIIGEDDLYKRFTVQINGTYNIKPWLEVGTNNTLSYIQAGQIDENTAWGRMQHIVKANPLTPVEYANGLDGVPEFVRTAYEDGLRPFQNPATGNYYGVAWYGSDYNNPVSNLYMIDVNNKAFGVNGMTYANIKPLKNLIYTTRLGYRFLNLTTNRYDIAGWSDINSTSPPQPYLWNTQTTQRYWQWENFFNYNFTLAGMDFGLMGGMSYSDRDMDFISVNTDELANEAANFHYLDYSTMSANDLVSGYNDVKRQIAYYGRYSWSYLNRYNFQVNFRADSYDAAYLDLQHNWGYFPSVSAGWTFTEEDFMKDRTDANRALTFGKLRWSWGKNGSVSNLGGYMYAATLNSGPSTLTGYPIPIAQNAYWMDGSLHVGTYPSQYLANPRLRWEESTQFDAGIDLRFFNGRLNFAFDYYNKITDGLLVQSVSPLTTGTNYMYQNLGEVNNHGFEIEAEWKDRIGDFSYGLKANLSTVSNKVTEYRGEGVRISGATLVGTSTPSTYFEEGYPLWYIRGYKIDHIDEATGEAIFQDLDGEAGITDADRTNLGKGIPDYTYGLSLNLGYKNFDLSAYGAGAQGSELLYGLANNTPQKPRFLYNGRWTDSNRNAAMPSALFQADEKFYNSDAFVFDASFFKIKQIQLGYSLPKSLLKPLTGSSVRLYVSLDNFFTFTDYPGNDPETRPTDAYGLAVDFGGYPISRSYSFGLNINF
jgi:TonB-linked SusC/RagA family outer membrane protein